MDGSINSQQAGDRYQWCCTSLSFKGPALAGYLIPRFYNTWGHPEFFNYIDRWMNHGLLTQPDPCAPLVGACSGGSNPGARCTSQTEVPGAATATNGNSVCLGGGTCNYSDATALANNFGITYGPNSSSPGTCILDPNLVAGSTMQIFSCQAGKTCGRFPLFDGNYAAQGYYNDAFTDAMWAAFRGTTYNLVVSRSGSGSGTITSSPGGINCGSTCGATLSSGTVVTLTETPSTGSIFSGWSGPCSGTDTTCRFTVASVNGVAVAAFNSLTPTLWVTKSGSGSGIVTSSPAGINCGSTCSVSLASGTVVTLTEAPSTGVFNAWTGGCAGAGTTCNFTMGTSNVEVDSIFTSSVTSPGSTVATANAAPALYAAVVYPNPVKPPYNPVIRICPGIVNSIDVTIFDVTGRVVNSGTMSGNPTIPSTGVGAGQYCYEYLWSGRKASGAYFAVVHAHGSSGTIKARMTFAVVQ